MSRRAVARAPGRGSDKSAALANAPPVDPRLTAVADWLRNEKKSGLHTKEAVQYEKVRGFLRLRLRWHAKCCRQRIEAASART